MNAHDATADEVRPGAILAGRYLVERQLGEGGMGVVVAARHLQLGHRVAIKFLAKSALADHEAIERFMREAWAAAQLKSPHVIRVSDVASLPSGAPFLVMEYLEGEDLADLLERRGRLPADEAVVLMLQVCEAIAEAHAIGIVHRDLKPSNIFCVRERAEGAMVKVLDFGISKLMHPGLNELTITTTRTALGSPLYMSPEQMTSAKVVDARTDIWSMGVILHELIAGEHPFVAASLPELAIKVATEAPRSLRAARPEVPVGLERVIRRCLEKERTKRFADVAAFASALLPYASTARTSSPDRIQAANARRYLVPAAVLVAVIALSALFGVYWRSGRTDAKIAAIAMPAPAHAPDETHTDPASAAPAVTLPASAPEQASEVPAPEPAAASSAPPPLAAGKPEHKSKPLRAPAPSPPRTAPSAPVSSALRPAASSNTNAGVIENPYQKRPNLRSETEELGGRL